MDRSTFLLVESPFLLVKLVKPAIFSWEPPPRCAAGTRGSAGCRWAAGWHPLRLAPVGTQPGGDPGGMFSAAKPGGFEVSKVVS